MTEQEQRPLAVLILAAGPVRGRDGVPSLLRPLGDKRVIDYVIDNALTLTTPEHIFIVIGQEDQAMREHLGDRFTYILQEERRGTGHAVLQAQTAIGNAEDVLILYGDTPLLRPSSLRGLLNRHRLKGAALTFMTAIAPEPARYGRVVRDARGHIIDIIEEEDASQAIQEIREVNVGAYAARPRPLFRALERLSDRDGSHIRLTDVIHTLVRAGEKVESYRIYDPEEIVGINTEEDAQRALFILQKRQLRPRRVEEESLIRFGTGGWRAVIGEGFTMHNVRRLAQAIANHMIREGKEAQGVLIGYDRRFLSDRAAEVAAEVFAGNNIPVTLLPEDAPTPLITYAAYVKDVAYGLAFTASHNPPEYNGLKVFHADGSILLDEESRGMEEEANRLTSTDVVKVDFPVARDAGVIQVEDYTNEYVDAVEAQVDMRAIRDAGLRVIIDPMHGTGHHTLGIVLTEARCRLTVIHERRDPLFGGRSPAPNLEALRLLSTLIQQGQYDLGLATDGDADRIAILDEQGRYIHTNDVLLLLYAYLHQVRGERGPVVRNLATTHLLDRLAAHFGERAYEVPVGFKHIAAAMKEHNALLGGESSGGLTIRGHILGKDGILAAALVVEMLAKTGKRISQLLEEIYAITGRLYFVEENIPATPEMRVLIPRRIREAKIERIGPYPVQRVSYMDGIKFYLGNDNWLLMRFSGTEPLLRIFAEADTEEKAQELVQWGKQWVR
ncbi:MAG: NTP transferase domain-containing protein [Chloroflexi bacterium]|nr:NTP transferase domain-containing protein [Chloroflexota bacterium]